MASNDYAHRDGWRRYQPHLPGRLPLTESELPREERWGWQGLEVHLDPYAAADAPLTVLGLHDGGGYGRLMAPMGVVERRPARALSRSAATAASIAKATERRLGVRRRPCPAPVFSLEDGSSRTDGMATPHPV